MAVGSRVAVVIPARNEAGTIGDVVGQIHRELGDVVDELVVMDSLSTDDTARLAAAAGAQVHSVAQVRPDLGVQAGKGEALWKSLFVTTASNLIFIDADLHQWGTHFVTDLLRPLQENPELLLVKGFYDRLFDDQPEAVGHAPQGGRVTELVARPLIALRWPELADVVQPLAGEWAIRRSLFETLPVPVGYGVELASLIDTYTRYGRGAITQVDLGTRGHRHQNIHDLGVMATEILAVADRRSALSVPSELMLRQFHRESPGNWRDRPVPMGERPPAREIMTLSSYSSASCR